jgi:RimJ/RimL family protein N-acetyltransferase
MPAPKLPRTLTTDRLRLRPAVIEDAPAVFRIFSDSRVTRFWFEGPMIEMVQAERRIEELNRPNAVEYAVAELETDMMIGTLAIFAYFEGSRRAEIGYALDANHWGKGLMFEAASAVITRCFTEADLNRLEADIDPRNAGSEKLLRRLGFKEEGYMRERWIVDGVKSDTQFFGLLKSEWESQNYLE